MDDAGSRSPGLLDGQVAIVTGGAGGIGRGISTAFVEQGAAVAVVDNDADRLAGVTAALPSITALEADVRQPDTASHVVDEVLVRHGRIDVLVNNVGHFRSRAGPSRSRPTPSGTPSTPSTSSTCSG